MRRWSALFGIAFVTLLLVAYIVPVHDCIIDLQPDGTNLGTIPSEQIRIAALVIASFPLVALAAIVTLSGTIRAKSKPVGGTCVGVATIVGFLMLGFIFWLMRPQAMVLPPPPSPHTQSKP
ncbi:MAG: hypothetical protein ABSF98_05185 [Bryobacteraceae bacterium]|jgi:hypothetical protein